MRELTLAQPERTLEREAAREADERTARRDWEACAAECGPLAYRLARSVLRNDADAEDVAQEAMLKAYQQFDRLRDPARFRGWLARIAFRMALDRRRSSLRREQRELNWAAPEIRSAAPNAEELAASAEFRRRLEAAMDELPDKHRLVLLLAAVQGYTLEEVGKMLGVPMGTVKSRLFKARKQLAEKLR
jgi:RNA polymerase sigma-70 factor, ECF subfamily